MAQENKRALCLRPYQSTASHYTREAIAAGIKRILLVAPPGAGKTIIAAHLAAHFIRDGKRILLLAHRREIIEQTSKALARAGVRHGFIMAGKAAANGDVGMHLATIQTGIARRDSMPPADIIIVDEAHRTPASSYLTLLQVRYPNAQIIGLTGTPWRIDGKSLGDVYEDQHVVVTAQELVAGKHLIEPVIFAPEKSLDLSRLRVEAGDYHPADLDALVNQAALCGDIVEHWHKRAKGLPTIAFAVNQDHSQRIVDQFRLTGVAAAHIDCGTPRGERESVLNRLRSGDIQVVSNVDILTEGFDMPHLRCVILARPTRSRTRYHQSIGRVMRSAEGKTEAVCLDHAGSVHEHGFPTDPHGVEMAIEIEPCPCCEVIIRSDAKECNRCDWKRIKVASSQIVAGLRDSANDDGELTVASKEGRPQCKHCGGFNVRLARDATLGPYRCGLTCRGTNCRRWSVYTDCTAAAAANDDDKRAALKFLVDSDMYRGRSPSCTRDDFNEIFGHYPEEIAQ